MHPALFSWFLLAVEPAFAGNTQAYFHDDEAALTAGAGLAITRTAGAVWYNPAGLGGIEQREIELSGSLFGFAHRRIPDAVTTEVGGTTLTGDLSENQLVSVPTTLLWAWRLGERVSAGVGVFVTQSDAVSRHAYFDQEIPQGDGSIVDFNQGMDIDWQRTKYHAGPALGWQLHPRLRLGMSALGVYDSVTSDILLQSRTEHRAGDDEVQFSWHTYERSSAGAGGGNLSLGVQWMPVDRLHLGMTVRSPTLTNWAQRTTTTSTSWAYIDSTDGEATTGSQDYAHHGGNQLGWAWVDPWQLAGGVAVDLGTGWLAAQGSFTPAMASGVLASQRRPLWNASVGGKLQLRDKVIGGVGLFTDRSPYGSADSFGHEKVDFYGLALGLQLETPFRVVPDGDPEGQPDRIVFTSTWAVKYALGLGEVRGLIYDASELGAPAFSEPLLEVNYHELGLHIGSGLAF